MRRSGKNPDEGEEGDDKRKETPSHKKGKIRDSKEKPKDADDKKHKEDSTTPKTEKPSKGKKTHKSREIGAEEEKVKTEEKKEMNSTSFLLTSWSVAVSDSQRISFLIVKSRFCSRVKSRSISALFALPK